MTPVERIGPQDWMASPGVEAVLAALTADGAVVRFVGGCVRDAVIGRAIAGDIDPAYQDALGEAIESGVEAYCYRCPPSLEGIEVEAPLPLKI